MKCWELQIELCFFCIKNFEAAYPLEKLYIVAVLLHAIRTSSHNNFSEESKITDCAALR